MPMRIRAARLGIALLAASWAIGGTGSTAVAAESWVITAFHSDITIASSSTLTVTEDIYVDFGSLECLADVLQAVVGDTDQPHAEGDGRIPAPVDDPVEVGRGQPLEERPGPGPHRLQVLHQDLGAVGSDLRHLCGRVAVAVVLGVRVETEATGPPGPDPELLPVEQL